ncbi:hypothetical protein CRG98_010073 [Punica granatum]|uniref:Cytochrome P450 CYP749A22-like n=1 Tax=Punica granatum TaxID=22663 RepID=A0A2I0KM20_PUNGR|nr:hypothetical protein CRG98_010073 [Punica granatum]
MGSTGELFCWSSVSGVLLLLLCLALVRVVYELWWKPIQIQRMMVAQGIKGLPYRFFHGSTKEILGMIKEAMQRPMDHHLSHDIFPRIQPHVHAWVNTYGPNYLSWFGAEPMVDNVHMMLEKWKDHEGKEIEVFEEFTLLTSEVISRTAFGSSSVEGRNIFEMLKEMAVLTSRYAFKVRLPGISKIWKMADKIAGEKLEKGICDDIIRIIKKREEKIASGESDGFGNDFLGLPVQAFLEEDRSKKITVDELVVECKAFYVAGQETTNATLTWMVFFLAVHSEWQEEARKEVLNVFGRRDPYYDGVAKLKKEEVSIEIPLNSKLGHEFLDLSDSRIRKIGLLCYGKLLHSDVAKLKKQL